MVQESNHHIDHTVTRDNKSQSVWVNGPVNCLGRFTPLGFEIYRKMGEGEPEPAQASSNMIECKIKTLTEVDWGSFKTLMKTHHGIDLSETQSPFVDIEAIKRKE